jgi:hypothetical protein
VKRIILKRLLLLSAMAAMVLVPAVAGMADTSIFQGVDEGGVTQDSSSESESADLGQTFEVAGSGDNSDQCAGVQGAGNTTPLEGGTHILQSNSDANDFSFEEVGGSQLNIIQADAGADQFEFDGEGGPLTVDGTSETSCDQQANQSGSASG